MSAPTPDFRRAYLLAQLSAGVYEIAPNSLSYLAASLELEFVAAFEAPGFQAMIVREPDGGQIVAFRGTPVTCGRDIEDAVTAVGDDACLRHLDVGGGAKVLRGPMQVVRAQMPAIGDKLVPGQPVTFTGHSLGAVMALLAPSVLPRSIAPTVTVFAPFQAANSVFWAGLYGGRPAPLMFGRARDFAPGSDHLDPVTCHAGALCHLDGGSWSWVPSWPWFDDDVPDHAVAGYVADLAALVAEPVEA